MTLSLTLPPELESWLRQRAAASGQAVDAYASRGFADAITAPTIDELLAPVRRQAADAGMREEELMSLGRGLLEKVREVRKGSGQ
jgi:hypothetical protein